jgi:hypothetical protein
MQLLICRLIEMGVSPDYIPALIRNALRIIGEGGLFTTRLVNAELEQLGWGHEVLDETSFQLIVYMLESEWGYRVKHYHPGSIETTAEVDRERLGY